MVDQPFWGNRVHAIGAGPKPTFVKNLSVDKLADAIVDAGSKTIYERAPIIDQNIRDEEWMSRAIRLIETCLPDAEIFKVGLPDSY